MSWRVRALEQTVGARLFERSGKGVKLTATGVRFYEHALRITDASKQMLQDVAKNATEADRIPRHAPRRRGPKRKSADISL